MKKILFMSLCLAMGAIGITHADTQMTHGHKSHAVITQKSKETAPVNINEADAVKLQTLKGLGVKKSEAIVAYRQANGPFKSVADLAKVKGIGAKMVARLQTNNPNRIVINNLS